MRHVLPQPSRVLIFALGLGLMVSLAQAQWIEDSVNVGTTQTYSMAYNPTADVIYGIGYDAFFAIDCATNQLITSVPSGSYYGLGMAYGSTDGRGYYTVDQYDSVVVVDGTTHNRIRAIAMDQPDFLVWDPDLDRLYVCQPDNNRVAVIDCRTDSLLTRIHVGANPDRLYLNRPQHKLYVLNRMGNSVSIIDLNTLDVIETISVDYPNAGWYAPAAGKFYCGTGAEVSVIDGVGDSLRKVIPLGTPNVVNNDGVGGSEARGLVLAGTYYDTVMVIDIATDSLVRRFHAGGSTPSSFLYSAASDRFYCGNRHSNVGYNVAVIAPDGSGVLRTLPVPTPVSLVAAPAHGRIYVGTQMSQCVYVLRDSATGVCEPGERRELPVIAAQPNPFRQAVTFSAPAGIAGPVRIWNAAGALVRTLPGRSGADDWIWDGRDESGRAVVPGVYCATLDGAPGTALKLVRLP